MIYSTYNNPKVPDWSISAAYLSVDDPTELGVVYTTQPGHYMVYLSDKDLYMGAMPLLNYPKEEKYIIHLESISTSPDYWLDELGKVRLCNQQNNVSGSGKRTSDNYGKQQNNRISRIVGRLLLASEPV